MGGVGAAGSGCLCPRMTASGCRCTRAPPGGTVRDRTRVRSCGLAAFSAAILAFSPAIHCRSGGFPVSASVTT